LHLRHLHESSSFGAAVHRASKARTARIGIVGKCFAGFDVAFRTGRPRTTAAKPAGGKRSSPSLSDQVLALASGKTQQEIAAACKGARPNHVGAAISRHKSAGRIEEREGKLYAT
jgi:hypothetical protein